ncbi:MAG TPA: DnaD domain-containing protein [Candidatus Avamphibacillus intestinigallinarum]|nr:DnaD domain-containing protein [Candidatus Avamphibacillus intestinigallinarum]
MHNIEQLLLNQMQIPTKLIDSYQKLGLNELELVLILSIHRFLQAGCPFPTPTQLSASLTIDEESCTKLLRKLIQKDLLSIEQLENASNQLTEAYSLEPLWLKLMGVKKLTNTKEQETETVEQQISNIFIMFEKEFGRPISPFEIEMINTWLDVDKLNTNLIQAALREAVLMGKLNFKYIDRILREWKKKGIYTVHQAQEASKSFRKPTYQAPNEEEKRDTSFYYNWLEGEE